MQTSKHYPDISTDEQARRLEGRRRDPLKPRKTSPIDAVAQQHWDDYSAARSGMLSRTHDAMVSWVVVCAEHEKVARLDVIRHLIRMSFSNTHQSRSIGWRLSSDVVGMSIRCSILLDLYPGCGL